LSGVENLTYAARNRLKGPSDWWTWAARISQIGLFVLALGYTVYVTQSEVVPIILSWVVATIFFPIIDRP
jgi:predicted PurR-regulated permease PerM